MLPLYDSVFAEKLSHHDLPPSFQWNRKQGRVASDRTLEFAEITSRRRAVARQRLEHAITTEHGATQAQPTVIDLATLEPEPIKQELNSSEEDNKQTVVEQRFIIVTPRTQASWVSEAYSACKANKKNLLKHADLLIIVDPNDYGKSCLVDSRDFGKASDSFARLYSSSQAESQGCASEQGLTALLLFSSTGPMPEFHPMLIDCSHAKLTQTFEPQEQPKARRQKAERMRVKLESDPTPANNVKSDQTSSSEKRSTPTCTDWAKASDSLLRIITRVRAHGVSKTEPATALPQIEGIIRIAQKYDVIHAVQSDFDSLFFGYVGSGKFWELIAQEPVRCLKIGIALKNLPVYEEAFKHLVGIGANSKTGVHLDGLPDEIQAIVHHRSWELYGLRRDVNEDLLLISLAVGEDDAESTPPPEYQSSTVNQNYNPDAYSTVNIVRDWMAEHIGYLRCETSRAPRLYYLCDHGSGCNTVAGFYRAIAAGRDAYLLFDMVWDTFNKNFLEKEDHDQERDQFNPEVVKSPLDALKKKASEYVGALVKSTLHLPSKDELDYLTCVTVESEDVPWDVSGKGGEGEDSDGD